jgi:hypothetical protein
VFGLRPKLPVSDEERQWVDEGFRRLGRMLRSSRMTQAKVVLPTDECFPDAYDSQEAGLQKLFLRVCGYMSVDPQSVELSILRDTDSLAEMLPQYHYQSKDPAGVHFGGTEQERPLIAVNSSLLRDPLAVIATLAHELGHVILLGGGHMSRETEDMEPMTDLVTVYLGFGVFTANSARRFVQFQDNSRQGWWMRRQGYLREEIYGYALARFAKDRGEEQPAWSDHLSTNVRSYFRNSAAWLKKESRPIQ